MATTAEMLLAGLMELANMNIAIKILAEQKNGGRGAVGGKALDVRHRQWPQFSGGSGGQYDDWAFAFKRVIRAIDPRVYEMLVKTEKIDNMDEIEREFSELDVGKYSAEIYDLICQCVTGEPLQIVRSVDDMEGLAAWRKLAGKYSPKSMARAVRLVGHVTNPQKIADLTKVESELDKWEDLVKTLQRDFKETFSDTVKVGIVTTMMPTSIQELVYQSTGKTVCYDDVVQKIRIVVSNKVAMAAGKGTSPMEIGEVKNWCSYGDHGEMNEENETGGEVGREVQPKVDGEGCEVGGASHESPEGSRPEQGGVRARQVGGHGEDTPE